MITNASVTQQNRVENLSQWMFYCLRDVFLMCETDSRLQMSGPIFASRLLDGKMGI